MPSPYHQNQAVWDKFAREAYPLAKPAGEKEIQNPGFITNPWGWIGPDVKGKRVLCLAAGGGKHSLLFALAGAETTVVDLSPAMLELDRRCAVERGLNVRIIQASMDNLSGVETAEFDVVIQPVSSCYVPDLAAVYREVARVLKPGGLYISQHKQPASLQAALRPVGVGYVVQEPYYRSGPLPAISGTNPLREEGALEYLHRWEDLLGALCRIGFVIEDVAEPRHCDFNAKSGTFKHRGCYLPPYIAIKARRNGEEFSHRRSIVIV